MNDSMGQYVASKVVKLMIKKGTPVKGAKVLMLGITYKENCPDIRNTKAIEIYHELREYDRKKWMCTIRACPVTKNEWYGRPILKR